MTHPHCRPKRAGFLPTRRSYQRLRIRRLIATSVLLLTASLMLNVTGLLT